MVLLRFALSLFLVLRLSECALVLHNDCANCEFSCRDDMPQHHLTRDTCRSSPYRCEHRQGPVQNLCPVSGDVFTLLSEYKCARERRAGKGSCIPLRSSHQFLYRCSILSGCRSQPCNRSQHRRICARFDECRHRELASRFARPIDFVLTLGATSQIVRCSGDGLTQLSSGDWIDQDSLSSLGNFLSQDSGNVVGCFPPAGTAATLKTYVTVPPFELNMPSIIRICPGYEAPLRLVFTLVINVP